MSCNNYNPIIDQFNNVLHCGSCGFQHTAPKVERCPECEAPFSLCACGQYACDCQADQHENCDQNY